MARALHLEDVALRVRGWSAIAWGDYLSDGLTPEEVASLALDGAPVAFRAEECGDPVDGLADWCLGFWYAACFDLMDSYHWDESWSLVLDGAAVRP